MNLLLAADSPVDHVVNVVPHGAWAKGDLFGLHGVWLWSAHVGTLLLAGLLTLIVMIWAAGKIKTGPESMGADRYVTKNKFAHAIEVICTFLRDQTVRPLLGSRTDGFMPFLWTVFFFILFNNLLGLTPIGDTLHMIDKITHPAAVNAAGQAVEQHGVLHGLAGATPTQNLFVTAALAIVAALVINLAGIRELGLGGYISHLTAGTPWYLWPLMIPIEIMGTIIKPVALALRLFANMTAGHILVAVLMGFGVQGLALLLGDKGASVPRDPSAVGVILGGAVSIVSVIATIAIFFLELFVAFLQAYVFMFLCTVFISQLAHHDEHEHYDEHPGHEHAHA